MCGGGFCTKSSPPTYIPDVVQPGCRGSGIPSKSGTGSTGRSLSQISLRMEIGRHDGATSGGQGHGHQGSSRSSGGSKRLNIYFLRFRTRFLLSSGGFPVKTLVSHFTPQGCPILPTPVGQDGTIEQICIICNCRLVKRS